MKQNCVLEIPCDHKLLDDNRAFPLQEVNGELHEIRSFGISCSVRLTDRVTGSPCHGSNKKFLQCEVRIICYQAHPVIKRKSVSRYIHHVGRGFETYHRIGFFCFISHPKRCLVQLFLYDGQRNTTVHHLSFVKLASSFSVSRSFKFESQSTNLPVEATYHHLRHFTI